jgi:hypothetical protein
MRTGSCPILLNTDLWSSQVVVIRYIWDSISNNIVYLFFVLASLVVKVELEIQIYLVGRPGSWFQSRLERRTQRIMLWQRC